MDGYHLLQWLILRKQIYTFFKKYVFAHEKKQKICLKTCYNQLFFKKKLEK